MTVTRQGQWELTITDTQGAATTTTTPWNIGPPTVATTVLPGCMAGYIGTGTVTVTADWVDMMGFPAPNPPAKVSLLFTSNSQWACPSSLTLFEHGAQDGWLEDPEVLTNVAGTQVGQSYGKHLVTYDGSSGHVQRTIALLCRAKAYSPSSSGGLSATVAVSANVDNRIACITSSLDPTYHRELNPQGQPVRVENRQDPVGAASYGDRRETEISLAPNLAVTYMANVAGGWASNSSYHWYDSATQQSAEGTFSVPTPMPAPLVSTYGWLTASGGDQAHIHLRVTDAATPDVQCTANYWLRFHLPHENWLRTSSVAKPRLIGLYPEDWHTRALICDNSGGGTITGTLDHDVQVSNTMTGSFGLSLGLAWDAVSLSRNEGISVGETRTDTLHQGYQVTAPPYQRIEVWTEMITEARTGTASVWDEHGYRDDTTWQGTWVSNSLAVGTVCVYVYNH